MMVTLKVRIPAEEAVAHLWAGSMEPSWLVVHSDGHYEWRWGWRRPATPPGGWVALGPEWHWEGPESEPEGVILEQAQLEAVQWWAETFEDGFYGLCVVVGGEQG